MRTLTAEPNPTPQTKVGDDDVPAPSPGFFPEGTVTSFESVPTPYGEYSEEMGDIPLYDQTLSKPNDGCVLEPPPGISFKAVDA